MNVSHCLSDFTRPFSLLVVWRNLLLTESVQAGQNFGVVISVQTDAADQELFVDLPDHRAGAARLTLRHDDYHSVGVVVGGVHHLTCKHKEEEEEEEERNS